jgi:23S rRNA (uracil1939-C5)-methyltransferase
VDVLFMDPPRAGASFDFLQAILILAPKKIVYVSCNPETLADNLSYLTDGGYTMKKAVPVDMFPYTESMETAVLLVRTGA